LLDSIHCHLLPRSYLEIGVFEGKSLALALPCTQAIGVDPEPRIRFALDPSSMIFVETSDQFFERRALSDLVSGPVDLTFLDGLHHFEFVLRDFINSERNSSPDSVILVHDAYPHNAQVASRSVEAEHWAGDVWKLIVALQARRPDLRVHTVDVPPTGLAIVTGLDPTSTVLSAAYDEIVAELAPLTYERLRSDPARVLNVVADRWEEIERLLPPRFQNGDVGSLRRQRAMRLPPAIPLLPAELERRLGQSLLGRRLRSLKARLKEFTRP